MLIPQSSWGLTGKQLLWELGKPSKRKANAQLFLPPSHDCPGERAGFIHAALRLLLCTPQYQHSARAWSCGRPAHVDPRRVSAGRRAALPRPHDVFTHISLGHSVAPRSANWSINLKSRLAQSSYLYRSQEDSTHLAISILLPTTQRH